MQIKAEEYMSRTPLQVQHSTPPSTCGASGYSEEPSACEGTLSSTGPPQPRPVPLMCGPGLPYDKLHTRNYRSLASLTHTARPSSQTNLQATSVTARHGLHSSRASQASAPRSGIKRVWDRRSSTGTALVEAISRQPRERPVQISSTNMPVAKRIKLPVHEVRFERSIYTSPLRTAILHCHACQYLLGLSDGSDLWILL